MTTSVPKTGRPLPRSSKPASWGGINPQAYLTDVLARIVMRADTDPIDDLLPYNWIESRTPQGALIDLAA